MTIGEMLKNITSWADERNKEIPATELLDQTRVQHNDGSSFTIQHSFANLVDDRVYVVFSQHHRPLVFLKDDVGCITQSRRTIKKTEYHEIVNLYLSEQNHVAEKS